MSFVVAQDVAHAAEEHPVPRRRQRLESLLEMAGFQVSIHGRFWVSAEVLHKYATRRLKEISISALTRVQDSPATIVPESSSAPPLVRNRSLSQRTGGHAGHGAFSPQCRPLLRRRVRSRCDACFARFPQMAMLHHRRAWPRVRSTKRSVQGERLHAFTCVKSSPQIKSAMAFAIGSSRVSGERQRLSNRHVNCDCARRWPRSTATI